MEPLNFSIYMQVPTDEYDIAKDFLKILQPIKMSRFKDILSNTIKKVLKEEGII